MGLIISKEELKGLVKEWQRKKVKVVLTNGCVDLLHAGI